MSMMISPATAASPASAAEGLTSGEAADFGDIFSDAVQLVQREGRVSTRTLETELNISYCRAARIADAMQRLGIVPPEVRARPRARFTPVEA